MATFFNIDSKREFFNIVKYVRTHGEKFISETLSSSGTERRGYNCGDMFLFIWYRDYPSFMFNLDIGDGKHYYYYPKTGKVEVAGPAPDFKTIDIIA